MLELQMGILVLLIILSAFFSSVETALMSVSSIKARSLVRQKKKGAETLQRIKSNPERLLITILVGNNIVNISAAALATSITTAMFGDLGVGIATGVMTMLILVFGEITPKSYAAQNAVSMSLRVARPIEIMSKILFPIVRAFEALTNVMMRLFGSKKGERLTEDELKTIVTMGAEQGVIRKKVAGMMESLIEFEKTKVNEIMTPRSDAMIIDGTRSVGEVLDFVVKTPYSRYPVYQKEEGNIIGIADVDEILAAVKSGRLKKKMVTVSKKPIFIPENKDVMSLLSEFEGKEASMAIVVDEYGHFMGLVTMDDVLEEIVGDIFDKSKKPHVYIKSIGSGEFLVDGRTPISVLEEYVDLSIEDRGFDTVAGLILKHAGRIPAKGEALKIRNVRFTIEDASPRTVKKVRIKKL
jgi:CBS domain containing-hemolysin-like protein